MAAEGNGKAPEKSTLIRASDLIVEHRGMVWTPSMNPMLLPHMAKKPENTEPMTIYVIRIRVNPEKIKEDVPRGTLYAQLDVPGQHDVKTPPDMGAVKAAARAIIEEKWPDILFP